MPLLDLRRWFRKRVPSFLSYHHKAETRCRVLFTFVFGPFRVSITWSTVISPMTLLPWSLRNFFTSSWKAGIFSAMTFFKSVESDDTSRVEEAVKGAPENPWNRNSVEYHVRIASAQKVTFDWARHFLPIVLTSAILNPAFMPLVLPSNYPLKWLNKCPELQQLTSLGKESSHQISLELCDIPSRQF